MNTCIRPEGHLCHLAELRRHWICIYVKDGRGEYFDSFRSTTKLGFSNAIWTVTVRRGFSMTVSCKVLLVNFEDISVNSSSHSVNGDIAIQWQWSNPLTDYDKTLHNWLRPRDERVTQNLCKSALRERLAKYVKYKASLSLFLFPGLAYWSNPCMEFHARCLKTRVVT